MNKLIRSAAALLTSVSLFAGMMPLPRSVLAVDTETGIIDASDIDISLGECGMSFNMPDILAENGSSDTKYNYGDFIDANNRAVYDKIALLTEPSLDDITVKLPKAVTFTADSLEIDNDESFYNAVFSSCISGMTAATYDDPLIFWLDNNLTTVSANKITYSRNRQTGIYTFSFSELTLHPGAYANFSSLAEIGEYKLALENTITAFRPTGETRAAKVKSIHDNICSFTNYNINGRFRSSGLSALVVPGSVCEGYSKGFKLLCDKLDIPCVCVFGNYNEEDSTAHMWNYVLMEDGYWYAVDVTWDDTDGKYGMESMDLFLLKGSDDFFVEHTECDEFILAKLTYPKIASWNYGDAPVVTTTTTVPTTYTTTTTTVTITTTASAVTSTTTAKPVTTTTAKPVTTTAKPVTTTTTKSVTTTAKPVTTTAKPVTTTTAKPVTTTAKPVTTTTAKPVTTTAKPVTTTTAKPVTTTAKPVTTTTAKPVTTTTAKPATTTTKTAATSVTTAIPVTTTVTTTAAVEHPFGDVNMDGKVSIADLVYCATHVLDQESAPNNCDLNGDGRSDAYDVVIMRKVIVEIMLNAVRSGK